MSRDRNLLNHEVADSFFMTDEQISTFKTRIKSDKVRKPFIKWVLLATAAGLFAGFISPVLAPFVAGSTFVSSIPAIGMGVLGIKNFLQFMASMTDAQKEERGKHK